MIEGGKPVVQKKVGLEVFLSFADGTQSGPRPLVIFAHGLGGDKDRNSVVWSFGSVTGSGRSL